MNSESSELTKAEAATGTYDATLRSAFRHENAAEKQSGQFVAPDVDNGVVNLQLVLGLPLSEIAHVIWKHCIVVRNLQLKCNYTVNFES